MQVIRSAKVYDVCVIGSGAGGGMAAMVLTQAGADVVMLEAGPWFDSAENSQMFKWPYDSPRRGAATPERHFGEFDACIGGWTIAGEPYTNVPGSQFDWYRARNLGGRTHHWGRISLRFGPRDFKGYSHDGLGDDWPISYDDLSPYYDKVDRFVGIFGSNEGLYNEPDGIFLPPPRPRCYELFVKQGCEKLGIPVIPSRLSILTRPHNGRAACHYCAQCGRGCATHSNFSSPSVLLPPALETGRLEIRTNAMAREILTNDEGLATGVSYVNKEDMTEQQVQARIVVVAAGACESARLLLNSKSPRHPNGLANGSGVVGRYLMDTTGLSVTGWFPQLMNMPPHNEDGTGGMHLYMPWWGYDQKLDFARGYHIEFGGGRRMPGYGIMSGVHLYRGPRATGEGPYGEQQEGDPVELRGGGYGQQLKDDYRRLYGSTIGFAGRGEGLAYYDNYCEIDPNVVDQYGIPVLRFHYKWSDQELMQAKHMQETFREIIHTLGGVPLSPMPSEEEDYGLEAPGRIIHEVGVVRMGDDPKTSALNRYCQAHDARNVFVTDGAPFVSQPHKNTTWTILALAWYASDYIAAERKKGNL